RDDATNKPERDRGDSQVISRVENEQLISEYGCAEGSKGGVASPTRLIVHRLADHKGATQQPEIADQADHTEIPNYFRDTCLHKKGNCGAYVTRADACGPSAKANRRHLNGQPNLVEIS